MKRLRILVACTCVLALTAGIASANTVASSTMYFRGSLTDGGGGIYSGVLAMVDESALGIGDGVAGYDIYGKEGATAWFGDGAPPGTTWTSVTISNHDAWPTFGPTNTPDWYQYSLNLYLDGSTYKWALRNHPGATAANPWDDEVMWGAGGKPPEGVPMSGSMDWANMIAAETDVGAYIGAGVAEIPGGAASYGGGAGYWDMDWSWGSEAVPLQWPSFAVAISDLGGGSYQVSLTPIPEPISLIFFGTGLVGVFGFVARRKMRRA